MAGDSGVNPNYQRANRSSPIYSLCGAFRFARVTLPIKLPESAAPANALRECTRKAFAGSADQAQGPKPLPLKGGARFLEAVAMILMPAVIAEVAMVMALEAFMPRVPALFAMVINRRC